MNRPNDIPLPTGWTWERVEAQRAKWGIADSMVPIAAVPGACVAWGTINSVRLERGQANYEADCSSRPNYHDGTPRKRWHQLGALEQSTWV